MTTPRFTVYPYQPSTDGAYNAPLPLITCDDEQDATEQAEMFTDADIVVQYEDKQVLVARRVNSAWCNVDFLS